MPSKQHVPMKFQLSARKFAVVQKKNAAREGKTLTIAQLETLLGRAGQRSVSQDVVGARVWTNYTLAWSIAGGEPRFVIASGHRAGGPLEFLTEGPNAAPIDSYSLIYKAPGCLAPANTIQPH
jgi:hypothetical protein